jgi:hypothetical protein
MTTRGTRHRFVILAAFVLLALAAVLGTATAALAEGPGNMIQGTVTGRVDGVASPLSDIWVGVVNPDGSYAGWMYTGGDGTFSVGDLAPGSYTVWYYDFLGVYCPEYWDDQYWPATGNVITIQGRHKVVTADALLDRASYIYGTVTKGTHPVDYAYVWLYVQKADGSWELSSLAGAASDGTYVFGKTRPGRYIVGFSEPLTTGPVIFYPGVNSMAKATVLELGIDGTVLTGIDGKLPARDKVQ